MVVMAEMGCLRANEVRGGEVSAPAALWRRGKARGGRL